MNTADKESKQDPADSPLIRREAGEGWHPDGLNETLLGALVARETIIDAIAAERGDVSDDVRDQYHAQVERVAELKEQFGVSEPPPQMPPDAPGASE